ncbi:MAG: hypothetical protein KDI01_03690 [Halioglobus sp.]|nr:hypothetical protein [Halioglobus sp.]
MPAPNPTHDELLNWAKNYDKLWTAGDRQGWIDNYRTVLQGEAVRMLDPVSTPEKFGFKHCCEDSFDLFQDHVKFEIPEKTLFVLGNTVAWIMHNNITSSGKTFVVPSIETFVFEPDGSLVIRTWYDVPRNAGGELGASMHTYLPNSCEVPS